MRHYLLFILLLLGGGGMMWAQDAQVCDVKVPMVGERNSNALEISRVECTPTATTLYMEAYHRKGYWILVDSALHLRGVQTGREYPLLRCEGVPLAQKVFMPDSGNVSFRLVFPPLASKDTSFDFIEACKDGWFIKDVQLRENRRGKIHCRLSGTVERMTEASRLVLHREGLDARVKPFISIPVHSGKFEYDLYTNNVEGWTLYLWHDWKNGAWRPITFLSEDADLRFTFPDDKKPVLKTDGAENLAMQDLEHRASLLFRSRMDSLGARSDSLYDAGAYFSPKHDEWVARMRAASDDELLALYAERDSLEDAGLLYTPQALALRQAWDAVLNEEKMWKLRDVSRKPTVAGFFFVRSELDRTKCDSLQQALCDVYNKVYAGFRLGHPFHEDVSAYLQAHEVAVGKPYPDYVLTGHDGSPLYISELIRGKVAWVDLWASWCGPCRRHSKEMISVYEEFKDKGFTVVGIAREKSASDMEQAVKKDGYPWPCYAEIKDANRIWDLHGIGNAGGGTYLVDSDGTLLFVGASTEKVRELLRKKLGNGTAH